MSPPAPPGLIVFSRFGIANVMTAGVKEAFRHRPRLVESAPGSLRREVIGPLDRSEEIWLRTFRVDEESFRSWHRSHLCRESYQVIPKGLKLLPGETRIRRFEHVSC